MSNQELHNCLHETQSSPTSLPQSDGMVIYIHTLHHTHTYTHIYIYTYIHTHRLLLESCKAIKEDDEAHKRGDHKPVCVETQPRKVYTFSREREREMEMRE